MLYRSTRGWKQNVPASFAIKQGIAPDGGLFVPVEMPFFTEDKLKQMCKMDYSQRALEVLKPFLTDFDDQEIKDCISKSYSAIKFGNNPAPLHCLNENVGILELWHGPTCAFKDMALQILPHLLVKSLQKTGEKSETVILVATSGDTGKAALEGFKDVDGTKVIVFYPQDGVSEIQKLQMITQEGSNVWSVGVDGNFDDTQTGVKNIFGDIEFIEHAAKSNVKFSSANSINWGRLVPQIVYYISSYLDMVDKGYIKTGDKINYVVPTGNFGNILAAYYAFKMGLPINRLICASNQNNVLTDFINTGIYDRRRPFAKTISPSMDILISSNLERLLYDVSECNHEYVCNWMNLLKKEGYYDVGTEIKNKIYSIFWSDYSNDQSTIDTIREVYNEYKYVIDTHTAVAVDVYDKYVISTGDVTPTVVVSTASPFKFNKSVAGAILGFEKIADKTEFEILNILSQHCRLSIPKGLLQLDKKPVLHNKRCSKDNMKDIVKEILNI